MKIDFRKNILPHLLAVGLFVLVAISFSYPSMFEGKSLIQHDVVQGIGPGKELVDYRAETNEEALWSSTMFSGMPAYLVNMKFSFDPATILYQLYSLGLPHPAHVLFMSFLSYYVLLLVFGVRPWIAIAGAFLFGLNTFSTIGLVAGHNSKVAAIALMPLVLAGIHLAFRRLYAGFFLTAVALAMQLKTNHLQITYYLLLICFAYGIYQLIVHIKGKELKKFSRSTLVLILAAFFAIGLNLGRITTVLEYSKYSTRGPSELRNANNTAIMGLDNEYVFRYSNGIFETLVLFIPNIVGGSSQQPLSEDSHVGQAMIRNGVGSQQISQQLRAIPTYWGDQPLTAPYYAGAISVLIFVIGIVTLPRSEKVWLISLSVFGIMLSWGSNFSTFNDLMYDFFPGYNKFRSVTFTMIIPIFCFPLLGSMGLENLLEGGRNSKNVKKLFLGLGITGILALFFVLFASFFSFDGAVDDRLPSWFLEAVKGDRERLMRNDALRSLIFVSSVSVVLWLYLKEKISGNVTAFVFIVLTLIDIGGVSKRFLTSNLFERVKDVSIIKKQASDQVIHNDNSLGFRVLNLINPFNEAQTSYFHRSVGGYHGAKFGRYQDLIEYHLSPELERLIEKLQSGDRNFMELHVINMLNAKYFKFGPAAENVVANDYVNGPAWLISNITTANNADDEIDKLGTINTKTSAVIDITEFPIDQLKYSTSGEIKLTFFSPKSVEYEYLGQENALAIFSEIYYPEGWEVTIDGKASKLLRANYILRALEIPPGKHTISFTFKPQSYTIGSTGMTISAIFLVISFIVFTTMEIKAQFRN